MMALMRAALAVLVAAAALAGCNGIVTYRYEGAGNPSAQTYAPYAAMNGTILLVVLNNPYPNDRNDQAVLAVVSTHNPMQRYRFSLTVPPDWNGYTVVLGFGQTPVGNQSLCQNAQLPLRPTPPGRTALLADLCYGQQLVTEASGRSPAVGGPDDPTFASLVGQVMTELFALRWQFEEQGSASPSFRRFQAAPQPASLSSQWLPWAPPVSPGAAIGAPPRIPSSTLMTFPATSSTRRPRGRSRSRSSAIRFQTTRRTPRSLRRCSAAIRDRRSRS